MRAPTVRARCTQLLQIFLLLLLYPFVGVHHMQPQIAQIQNLVVWVVSVIQLNQTLSLKIPILLTVLLHTTFHLRINELAREACRPRASKRPRKIKAKKVFYRYEKYVLLLYQTINQPCYVLNGIVRL